MIFSKERAKKPSLSNGINCLYLLLTKVVNMSHLTREQRYTISVLLKQNFIKSQIALFIKKDKSVLTRELQRNCDLRSGKYDADLAQRTYEKRQKAKPKRIYFTAKIKRTIKEYLK